jgi:hypothetical protein
MNQIKLLNKLWKMKTTMNDNFIDLIKKNYYLNDIHYYNYKLHFLHNLFLNLYIIDYSKIILLQKY